MSNKPSMGAACDAFVVEGRQCSLMDQVGAASLNAEFRL
jgi:hypothetical protein